MSLHIICGRSHSGKSEYIMNLIKEKTVHKEKIILAVPEQFTHIAEEKLLGATGKIMDGSIEISSFKRLADRTRSICGDLRNNIISPTGKSLLVSEILENIQLEYYKNSAGTQGFVDLCLNTVSEFKKYNISPVDVKTLGDRTDDLKLKLKLDDLYKIYDEYENVLHKSYLDTDDVLDILINLLKDNNIYSDFTFFFDEFSTFIPQEREIISELIKNSKDVYITLCMDSNYESTIFSPCHATFNQLKEICRENNCKMEDVIWLDNSYYNSDEISFVEKNMFEYPTKMYRDAYSNVELIRANNPYAEVEYTANKIISLVRDCNYRYKDICVITSDMASYEHIFKILFPKYNLPFFLDSKSPVLDHNIVLFVLNILDVYLDKYSYESIFNFLKSGFIDLSPYNVAVVENFVLTTNASKNTWLNDDKWEAIIGGYSTSEEDKKIISQIRYNYILPLARFHEKIKGRKNCSAMIECLYDYLIEISFDKTIASYITMFKEKNDLVRSRQYEGVWNVIMRVFDEIVNVFGDKSVNVSDMRRYLYVAFAHQTIGIIPTSLDEITIGDIARTKTEKVKALFVLGANEGLFPMCSKDDLVLSDKDKSKLSQFGVELPHTSDVQAFLNQFLLYRVFTMPMNKLFVSYSSASNNYNTLAPAFSVGRFKKMFADIEIDYGFDNTFTDEFLADNETTLENMVSVISKKYRGDSFEDFWQSVYNFYEKNYPNIIKKIKEFFLYKNEVDNLEPEYVKKHLGQEMYTSVSRLQKYSACHYSYFLSYMLSLKDRPVSEIQAVDIGSVAHEMVERICTEMSVKSIDFTSASDDYFKSEINTMVDEYLDKFGLVHGELTKRQLYSIERLKQILLLSFKSIRKQIVESSFEPIGYEVTFGDDNIGCIKVELPDGKILNLTGKIDRVDAFEAEDGRYIRVIDYKTGDKSFNINNIIHATDIQLIIYLNALVESDEKNKYGGAFFFKLDDFILKSKHNETDSKIESKTESAMKLKGIVVEKEHVIKAYDNVTVDKIKNKISSEQFRIMGKYLKKTIAEMWMSLQSGNIDVNPYMISKQKPCNYCPYGSICRLEHGSGSYNELKSYNMEDAWKYMKEVTGCVD